MEPSEFTESGSPVYRHQPREKAFEPAIGDVAHIKLLEDHITKHIGAPAFVFHEFVSHLVHLDVHIVPPRPDRNFYTLITSGMSARSMKAPPGNENFSYAELLICLPPEWPLKEEDLKDRNNYWPIRLLKWLARMPHEYNTWLSFGHSIPNGNPATPFAPSTNLSGVVLGLPYLAPKTFWKLNVSPEMNIHIFSVLPLFPEEMALKLSKGSEEIFKRFEQNKITELVNVKRKNVAKKLLGLF